VSAVLFLLFAIGLVQIIRKMKKNSLNSSHKKVLVYVFLAGILLSTIIWPVKHFLFEYRGSTPSIFVVTKEARQHLKKKFGYSAKNSRIKCKQTVQTNTKPEEGFFVLDYQYDSHAGTLKAVYSNYAVNESLVFSDIE
jgi:hypothetical protein